MEKSIGIGLIVGLTTASTIFIYKSVIFTRFQKVILLICILFPPLQWLLTLIILLINHYRSKNLPENIRKQKIQGDININESKLSTLQDLYDKGLLTDSEYIEKTSILQKAKFNLELEKSDDYIKLKSLLDEKLLTQDEFNDKAQALNEIEKTKIIADKGYGAVKFKKAGFGCLGTIVVFIILYWILGKFM